MKQHNLKTLPQKGWAIILRSTGQLLYFSSYIVNPSVAIAEFLSMELLIEANRLFDSVEGQSYHLTEDAVKLWNGGIRGSTPCGDVYRCVKVIMTPRAGWEPRLRELDDMKVEQVHWMSNWLGVVGIVAIINGAGERKVYVGTGLGQHEKEDQRAIMERGGKLYPEQVKDLFAFFHPEAFETP